MRALRVCGLALFCSGWPTFAMGHGYPAKPVRIIVHFPPGGATDFVARAIGQKLSETWGQQVLIDNRPGAGGVVGVELGVRALSDGHTLLLATRASMTIPLAMGVKTPYNVFNDLAPISLLVINPQLLLTHPSMPVRSVKELVTLAKTKPGQINYASVGLGSPAHLGVELLKSMAGIDMLHIPYKGGAQATNDILAGNVSLLFSSMPPVLPLVDSKKLRGIAVSSAKRSLARPEFPTVAESGMTGFESVTWYGLFGPAGTPPEIIKKINSDVVKLLADAALAKRFISMGVEPDSTTPEQLRSYMRADYDSTRKLIEVAKIKIN